jgi:hypothetical protein
VNDNDDDTAVWSVGRETIRRHLLSIGFKSRAVGRQPILSPAQVAKRVSFAKDFKDFDWNKAVMVDETYAQDHGRTNPRNDRQWTLSRSDVKVAPRQQVAHPAQIGYFGAVCCLGVLPLIETYRQTLPTQFEKQARQLARKTKKAEEAERKLAVKAERLERKATEQRNKQLFKAQDKGKSNAELKVIRAARLKHKAEAVKARKAAQLKLRKLKVQQRRVKQADLKRRKAVAAKATRTMTAKVYITKCLTPLVRRCDAWFGRRKWTLFHDGAPYHRGKEVEGWLDKKKVKYVSSGLLNGKWPGNSPDLNPQEHVWAMTKQKCYKEFVGSLNDVDKQFRLAHDSIPLDVCQRLLSGMKGRLERVLALDGKHIGR